MRPFLLLATRAEDRAADDEYAAIVRYSGLTEQDVVRHRLESDPMPPIDLADWSGFILGGSPFNNSDPPSQKSRVQIRVEAEVSRLLDQVIPADFPLLGACYGIGSVGTHQGGLVDRTYGEQVSRITVQLTDDGRRDPIFGALPSSFPAFVGHKEAITRLPLGAVHLATSTGCPVQAFRVGRNVYATQFHPELDSAGLALRIDTYRSYGYFEPEEAEGLIAMAHSGDTPDAPHVLAEFCRRYARD